ncbi:MAG: 50S ribosomal protein L3 [Candidatus Micrarchaeota archaeon]
MGKKSTRRGSLSFWHRARAKRLVPRLRNWINVKGLSSFAGYKAGMMDLVMIEDSESPLKGQEVVKPVTIVEVPPMFIYAVNVLAKTPLGLKQIMQVTATNAPKEARRSLTPAKKTKGFEVIKEFEQLRLIALTQPQKISLKKTPEVMEIPLAGTKEEQLELAKSLLGKEVAFSDVFKEGEFTDVIAVTTGKGWQGLVKRFGVALNPHKATAHRRKGGTLGAETQARVFFSVPRPGQMGFQRRTDFNKRILKISTNKLPAFKHYGEVKGTYILLQGSIPGPVKRLIRLRRAVDKKPAKIPNIISIQV